MKRNRWVAAAAVACAGAAFAAWHGTDGVQHFATGGADAGFPTRLEASAPRTASAGKSSAAATLEYFRFSPHVQFQPLVVVDANNVYAVSLNVVAVGDVTGDNRDDVVVMTAGAPPQVWVLPQLPNGTLDTQSPRKFVYGPYNISSGVMSLMLGDMNEDGVLDIVTSGMHRDSGELGINVLLSDGAGGHTLRFIQDGIRWSRGVLVDADLDGHRDLVTYESRQEWEQSTCGSQYCTYRRILFGDGKGGFPRTDSAPMGIPNSSIEPIQPADLNGDGIADLALSVTHGPEAPPNLRMYLNDRSGNYVPVDHAATGGVFGDFDRNGLMDVFGGAPGGGLVLYRQMTPGVFAKPIGPYFTDNPFYPFSVASDLDRDGSTDMIEGQFECFGAFCNLPHLQTYLQLNGNPEATPEKPALTANWSDNEPTLATGNLNGDGCTDAVVATGSDGLLFLHGNHCRPAPPARNDFDGDHASDVVWHDAATGASNTWQGGSTDQRRFVTTADPTRWALATTGDFDGDGRADMVWRHRTTGMNILWMAGNARVTRTLATVSNSAWRIVGTGDFNRDRKADLVWRNGTSGQTLAWLSGNSATTMNFATVADQAWQIADIGDYDGDGRDDLFWRHGTRGLNTWWRGGNATTAIAVVAVATHWKVVGSGDFDRDGKDDLVWRGGNGVNAIWKSANPATQMSIATVTDTAWQIAAIGDYDDDGRDDLLWRNNTTGANRLWRKADASQQRFVATVATRWKAVR